MSEHTPGPWRVGLAQTVNGGRGWTVVDIVGADGACFMDTRHYSEERRDADSRLIAAAPDLLAALRYIAEKQWSSLCAEVAAEDMCNEARAALARAEGRS